MLHSYDGVFRAGHTNIGNKCCSIWKNPFIRSLDMGVGPNDGCYAAEEVARQLRLRNIGGLIVIAAVVLGTRSQPATPPAVPATPI